MSQVISFMKLLHLYPTRIEVTLRLDFQVIETTPPALLFSKLFISKFNKSMIFTHRRLLKDKDLPQVDSRNPLRESFIVGHYIGKRWS